MARHKLFISYSQRDAEWLTRLKVHLALLERQRIVQVWSDSGIGVGSPWRDELERALGESRAAVLLVSPDFLASDFIWSFEMPRILAHKVEGMDVYPLIARPCAWQLAPELADIQARPSNDRALSLGTDAQVDQDLARFAYELADRLGRLPDGFANKGTHLVQQAAGVRPAAADARSAVTTTEFLDAGAAWSGDYPATKRRFRLSVHERRGSQFRATIEYLDDDSATEVEGRVLDVGEAGVDRLLPSLLKKAPAHDLALEFRETRLLKEGQGTVNLNGEYRAVISGAVMYGNWTTQGRTVGTFELRRDK